MTKVRVRVSPEAAGILAPTATRADQLAAARGELPLAAGDQVTVLFFLGHRADEEIRRAAWATFRGLPLEQLLPVARDCDTAEKLLDFLVRLRPPDPLLTEALLDNPALGRAALLRIAATGDAGSAAMVAAHPRFSVLPEVAEALAANPALGGGEDEALEPPVAAGSAAADPAAGEEDEGAEEDEAAVEEEVNQSKYQLALEMGVSEKIKVALTGDKEWRTIFLKDANKLVSSAVLKNPRITEGEVLTVAKNRSAQEELIRLINMNREWIKNYEIRRALVMNPRTPILKALRYMNTLTEKDIKGLAKSRNVSQLISNNARRMVMAKSKKKS